MSKSFFYKVVKLFTKERRQTTEKTEEKQGNEKIANCRYKLNGKWIDAVINFTTGDITADNKVLWKGRQVW